MDDSVQAPKRVLIVAENRVGHGVGHLVRCARLAYELNGTIDWLLPRIGSRDHLPRCQLVGPVLSEELPVRWIDTPQGPYDLVVIDRRSATLTDLYGYHVVGISVGIDLAGEARRYVHYLIDTLQSPYGFSTPNIADAGLLPLPDAVRSQWPDTIESVLVSFGGSAALSKTLSYARRIKNRLPQCMVTATVSEDQIIALCGRSVAQWEEDGVRYVRHKREFMEELHRFDVVVTHYGLTAYEAVWAKVPVVLVNPTPYHTSLAIKAGFVVARSAGEVCRNVRYPLTMIARSRAVRPVKKGNLAHYIDALRIPSEPASPIDYRRWSPAVQRYPERTFFQHPDTNLVFMTPFRPIGISYNRDYFFREYEQQYGKTYLDDFPHIRAMGRDRIRWIRAVKRRRGGLGTVLDIGCAYGPFLQAVKDDGGVPVGIDIASDAIAYVRSTLGIEAVRGDFLDPTVSLPDAPYEVVTMWYVIEHFARLDRVLERVAELLTEGGIFAFSTPCMSGISARRDERRFLRESPQDHYTVFSRTSVAHVLASHGLYVKAIRSTGHHPERILPALNRLNGPFRHLVYAILLTASRLLRHR